MGVIDLDARVKKLEEGGTGGAVIDQLEAAVTDLEETVNGNGETDFGLVGDVAALQEAAVPVKTAVTTLSHGAPVSAAGGVFYEVLGNLVHVHVAANGFTATTGGAHNELFTLPAECRPAEAVYAAGLGNPLNGDPCQLTILNTGVVDIWVPGEEGYVDTCFILPAPAAES